MDTGVPTSEMVEPRSVRLEWNGFSRIVGSISHPTCVEVNISSSEDPNEFLLWPFDKSSEVVEGLEIFKARMNPPHS